MTTFDDWIKERDRILEDSDMDGLRRMLADVDFEGVKFPDQPDDVQWATFHKARYEATQITPAKRVSSGE